MCSRLSAIPAPPSSVTDAPTAAEVEDEEICSRVLDRNAMTLPSGWARSVQAKVRSVLANVHALHRVVNTEEATRAYHDARVWLETELRRARGSVRMLRTASISESPAALAERERERAAGASSPAGSLELAEDARPSDNLLAHVVMEKDDELDATIERLVAESQFAVRVPAATEHIGRAGIIAVAGAGMPPVRPTKVLSEASHVFERNLREGISKAIKEDLAASGGGASPRPASSGRKGSMAPEVRHLTAVVLVFLTHPHTRPTTHPPTNPQIEAVNPFGRRVSLSAQATAALKPKTRELHKMMASALQMTGTDLGEFLTSAAKVDTDEVVTREQLKRATQTQIRQVMRSLHRARAAAAAAAAKGGAGGGGGGGGCEAHSPKRTTTAGTAGAGL